MAKYFQIPFAMNGDRKEIPTDKQEDGSISFDEGYGADYEKNKQVDPTAKDISRQEFNSVLHDITDAVGEIQRSGVATWTNEISYNKGATIIHNGAVYTSTINANKNEPPHASWLSLDLSVYRKKDDLLFNGMMQVQATDDVGTGVGVLLQESDGTVRGQVVATDQGLQLTQYPKDGGLQTFTFPNASGELSVNVNAFSAVDASLNVADGEVYTNLGVPNNINLPGGIFLQSLHYDSKTDKFYSLGVISGKVGESEHAQVYVFDNIRYSSAKVAPTISTNIDEKVGHQGIGVIGEFLITSRGSEGGLRDYGNYVSLFDLPNRDGEVLNLVKHVKVWSENDGIRPNYANTVTVSKDGRFTLVHASTQWNSGVLYNVIKVFKTSTILEGGDVSSKEIYKFYVDLPITSEFSWVLQGLACDNTHVYVMCENRSGNFWEVRVYTLSGKLVEATPITVGQSLTSKYYETEGLFWSPDGYLGVVIVGDTEGEWEKALRKHHLMLFKNNKKYKNIDVLNGGVDIHNRERTGTVRLESDSNGNVRLGNVHGNGSRLNLYKFNGSGDSYDGAFTIEVSGGTYRFNHNHLMPMLGSVRPDIGGQHNRFDDVYLYNQPNVSSDSRTKYDINIIDPKYMEVMQYIDFKQFKLKDGTSGRTHFGVIAQDWIAACNRCGVDPHESGVLVGSEKEGYAIRYGELQNLFNAYILTKLK